jgi:hypothetical protein
MKQNEIFTFLSFNMKLWGISTYNRSGNSSFLPIVK